MPDIIYGALVCCVILVFFVVSSIYLRIDKYRLRISSFWFNIKSSIDTWINQTAEIAKNASDTSASKDLLSLQEQFFQSKKALEQIELCEKIKEIYEHCDELFTVGDQIKDRETLCSQINYELYYINDVIENLNRYIVKWPTKTIAKLMKIKNCPYVTDFN